VQVLNGQTGSFWTPPASAATPDRLLIQLVSGVLAAEPGQERRADRLPRS